MLIFRRKRRLKRTSVVGGHAIAQVVNHWLLTVKAWV
jgi:hypothetical protein